MAGMWKRLSLFSSIWLGPALPSARKLSGWRPSKQDGIGW